MQEKDKKNHLLKDVGKWSGMLLARLHPDAPKPATSSLLPSIAQLLNDIRSTGRFNIKFTSSPDIDAENFLSEEKKAAVFRILQEEISNIIRHSRAKNIRLNMMKNNSGVIVYMFDDGIGFDLREVTKGRGLANIRSGASQFNGLVDIVTTPGRGCSVTVLIPYD